MLVKAADRRGFAPVSIASMLKSFYLQLLHHVCSSMSFLLLLLYYLCPPLKLDTANTLITCFYIYYAMLQFFSKRETNTVLPVVEAVIWGLDSKSCWIFFSPHFYFSLVPSSLYDCVYVHFWQTSTGWNIDAVMMKTALMRTNLLQLQYAADTSCISSDQTKILPWVKDIVNYCYKQTSAAGNWEYNWGSEQTKVYLWQQCKSDLTTTVYKAI